MLGLKIIRENIVYDRTGSDLSDIFRFIRSLDNGDLVRVAEYVLLEIKRRLNMYREIVENFPYRDCSIEYYKPSRGDGSHKYPVLKCRDRTYSDREHIEEYIRINALKNIWRSAEKYVRQIDEIVSSINYVEHYMNLLDEIVHE